MPKIQKSDEYSLERQISDRTNTKITIVIEDKCKIVKVEIGQKDKFWKIQMSDKLRPKRQHWIGQTREIKFSGRTNTKITKKFGPKNKKIWLWVMNLWIPV